MNGQFIVMITIISFLVIPAAEAQTCNCDVILAPNGSGDLNIPSGKTYCLQSGTYNMGASWHSFNIAPGGTLCISPGAAYYVGWSNNAQGTIINRGTLSVDGTSAISATIQNEGTVTFGSLQNCSGSVINSGRFMINGYSAFISGSSINNTGVFVAGTSGISFTGTSVINSDSFVIGNGSGNSLNFIGTFSNSGAAVFNASHMAFTGTLDNTGYAYFNSMNSGNGLSGTQAGSGLSATVNNYGVFRTEGPLTISTATYFTNDSLAVFNNSGGVSFAGPMLTNNGRITLSGTGNDFNFYNGQTEVVNNSIIVVSGSFNMDASSGNARLTNNCRIVAGKNITVHNYATLTNSGLLWALGNVDISGDAQAAAGLRNMTTGFVRGVNFINSGKVTGFGRFYFTGNTDFRSAGVFAGDSANNPIQFYDVTQSSPPAVFDSYVSSNLPVNTVRPSSMLPMDTTGYDCTAPATVAGNPPNVKDITINLCESAGVTVHLSGSITPYDNAYTIDWSTLRLFSSPGGLENATYLSLPGKGSFAVNSSTGDVTFTPVAAFTNGAAVVEYKVADKKAGDPISYMSLRKKITITISPISPPATIDVSGY